MTPNTPDNDFQGLYLHVPFCYHKCHYCDFYSIVDNRDRQGLFTDALLAELQHWTRQSPLRPQTIFVGGGTPTLLRAECLGRLLTTLASSITLDDLHEFTIEANPETVSPELMQTLAAGGVNRISMGAQSFQPELLKALERWHEPASVGRAVRRARQAGIDNINLDLIFAIPGQTMAQLDADLDALLDLEPTHVSCYSLIFEPHTPLTVRMQQGLVSPLSEDTEQAMFERVIERLDDAGFEHYEVSNWAKRPAGTPGETFSPYRCQHNLIYWRNQNWLGLGPSAASHLNGQRWKTRAHLGRYLADSPTPPREDEEQLQPARQVGEQLMMGLRLREGVPLGWLEQNLPADDARWSTIREFTHLGLIERTHDRLRLTQRGLFVTDAVV